MDRADGARLRLITSQPADDWTRAQAQAVMELTDEGTSYHDIARSRIAALDLDEAHEQPYLGSYENDRAKVLRALAAAHADPSGGSLARLQAVLDAANDRVPQSQLDRVWDYLERAIPEVLDVGSEEWDAVKADASVVLDNDEPRGAEAAARRRLM